MYVSVLTVVFLSRHYVCVWLFVLWFVPGVKTSYKVLVVNLIKKNDYVIVNFSYKPRKHSFIG